MQVLVVSVGHMRVSVPHRHMHLRMAVRPQRHYLVRV
jgi:hypothetical protein